MDKNKSLYDYRLDAAVQSKGTSGEYILNKILTIVKSFEITGRVLDFGAGIGNMSKYLFNLNQFKEVVGTDILQKPDDLPKSIEWVATDLNIATPFSSQEFDCIISPEVIEHLENPRAIIREWFRLLNNQGTLIFSTPNNHSWRSIFHFIIKGHFVAFADSCYPAHITALTNVDMSRILSEVGFTKIEFYYTDHGGLPKVPNITWQQVSFGVLKGKRFSDNIICLAKKI